MTAKRFTIEIDDENIAHILDNGTDIGQYNLCKLLNNLFNENEQLKHFKEISDNITKEVEDFFEKHEFDTVNFNVLDEVFDDVDYYYEKCIRLNKENEQLKHRLAISEKANFVTALAKENEQLKKENNELKLLVQNWESLDDEKDSQLDKQNNALKKLKKENQLLKERLAEQNDIEWLRNNTVWEVMPSNRRTFISTIYHRRNDE